MDVAIRAEGLVKSFGTTRAVDGVDLVVDRGTVLGLLGPNGAGKTTIVRILATLLRPDGGRAEVAGHDVVAEPGLVRAAIGLTGQYAAVDELLTGAENLEIIGRLAAVPKREALTRTRELLERFDLADAADRPVRTYSGGMRRRLDLAASLVARASILFLDEPTTGLDPRSRLSLWAILRELVAEGTTLLLTTQYLEEADQLAEAIVVIDHGSVIAEGSADQLKEQVGGSVLELRPTDPDALAATAEVAARVAGTDPHVATEQGLVRVPLHSSDGALTQVVRELALQDLDLADVSLKKPSLDDVFLALTGHTAEEEPEADPVPAGRGRARSGGGS